MGYPMNGSRRSPGFSLLELCIAIAVTAIVSAIAIPGISKTLSAFRLWHTSQKVKTQIQTARTFAIVNPRRHCGIFFKTDSIPCKVLMFIDNGNNKYDSGVDELYGAVGTLPQSISLKISERQPLVDNVIIFRGDGSAKNGGTVEVLCRNSGNKRIINVLATTGRIKLSTS